VTIHSADHPENAAEAHKLQAVLAALEARREELGQMRPKGPTAHDTASLLEKLREMYRTLQSARQQVYFGRLDFIPAGKSRAETHYIGRIGFDKDHKIVVMDWRAPAARLFSRRRPGPASYDSPDGTANVVLELKRQLVVERHDLLGLFDEYDTRPGGRPAKPGDALVDPDAFLREVLSGRRQAHMADIVATIQEHQDELIRADPAQVLVVQGVAGSGKTSIALHRVAYLLYPGNQTGIEARRCIIFGPNQIFLGYIANVLPGLGVADIPQTTLDAWALERLGLADVPLADATLEALLAAPASDGSPRAARLQAERTGALVRRSQLKAGLRLGRVLDNLLAWWRTQLNVPAAGLAYDRLGPLKVSVRLSADQVREQYRALATLPLARHQQRLEQVLLGLLMGAYASAREHRLDDMEAEGANMRERHAQLLAQARELEAHAGFARQQADSELDDQQVAGNLARGAEGLRTLAAWYARHGERRALRAARLRDEARAGQQHEQVRVALHQALQADLRAMWPPFETLPAYFELLADEARLSRLARGVLSLDEIDGLHAAAQSQAGGMPGALDASGMPGALDASDLPALCYLHTAAHGLDVPLYDHVVVDEAQDVAPLYYAVLRRYSRNGSFTILGDLAQGVYSYRGILGWDDVRRVFEGLPYTRAEVSESYRSTHEIISFANRLLELLAPAGQAPLLARPFERHAEPVRFHQLGSPEALAPGLARTVQDLSRQGYENIAIIAKSAAACRELAEGLQAHGTEAAQLITAPDQAYDGGLVILPVHLAKGMEFEAVLIAGADDANYAASEFDGRLLYVAATRALHALHVFAGADLNTYMELAAQN
jgi:DNA helicase II / ATP-dependent DNA helicase PcrA